MTNAIYSQLFSDLHNKTDIEWKVFKCLMHDLRNRWTSSCLSIATFMCFLSTTSLGSNSSMPIPLSSSSVITIEGERLWVAKLGNRILIAETFTCYFYFALICGERVICYHTDSIDWYTERATYSRSQWPIWKAPDKRFNYRKNSPLVVCRTEDIISLYTVTQNYMWFLR